MKRFPKFKPSPQPENGLENTWAEVHERSAKRMRAMDALPQGLREIVHDFNMEALSAAISHGLKTPQEIREVLEIMQRDGLDAAIVRADQILVQRRATLPQREVIPGRLTRPHDRRV